MSRALGNERELKVRNMLRKLGYRADRISVSGWTKHKEGEDDQGIPCDVVGYAPADSGLPHVWAEVGGQWKAMQNAFDAMKPLPPGHIALVVRVVRRRWVFTREGLHHFKALETALRSES